MQLSGCIHRNVMNTADVPESVERRDIGADTHKFIYELALNQFLESQILVCKSIIFNLLVAEQLHIVSWVERQYLSLVHVYAAHNL